MHILLYFSYGAQEEDQDEEDGEREEHRRRTQPQKHVEHQQQTR